MLDVNWKALNKTTVRVTWKEPLIKNGLITNFTVSYTEDFSLPVSLWAVKVVPGNKYSAEVKNEIKNFFFQSSYNFTLFFS